jgi:hypothetical protein
MPETLFVKDFSAGWIPSDDSVNGRPNGLLQMDNLELDTNGALALIGGTTVKQSGFSATAHTLYSRYFGATRHDYSALTDGSIWRDNVEIINSGDTTNAAFSTAFDFVLACTGSKRYKDSGSGSPVALGVVAPTVAPVFNPNGFLTDAPYAQIGTLLTNTVTPVGTSSVVTSANYPSTHARPASIQYLQLTADGTSGFGVVQTYAVSGVGPFDLTTFTGSSGDRGTSTDNDYIPLYGYITSPWGCSLQIDILLIAGDSAGDQVSDYYSYSIADLSTLNFDPVTGVFSTNILRSQFTRMGSSSNAGWANVYGFRLTFQGAPSQVINLLGNVPNPAVASTFLIFGGSNAQFGVYQFAQVNVNNTGSYNALSTLGPATQALVLDGIEARFQVQAPTDPQVNEVWIFAQSTGGSNDQGLTSQLNAWYRVARLVTGPFTSSYYITQGDLFTLALDITFNTNLISIADIAGGVTTKIFDIVGPIEGRWFYFTSNFMYPSDINDPDLVDASLAVRTAGTVGERLMWARAISASVVLVGTTCNVYLLTGTFTTLPDGSIDVYYQPLGVTQFPPITYDAVSSGGSVYYLANDGWRMCVATSFGTTYSSQNNQLIVAPNTDRLYRNETCYGYTPPNLKIEPGTVRFPVTIARNKLWCFITGTGRCEVYDFGRAYWRTFNYSLGDVGAVTNTQDGQTLAFYNVDLKLREIGVLSSKLIDGATQQFFKLLLTYKDNGKPRQRKDTYTLKTRCYTNIPTLPNTGPNGIVVHITDEQANTIGAAYLNSSVNTSEQYIDLSQLYASQLIQYQVPKTYQIGMSGTVPDLLIEDISIDYDARPIPVSFLLFQPSNLGSPTKKRIRTWPLVIDTRGNTVVWTPNVDNVNQPSVNIVTNYKSTQYYFFNTDVFGIDYGATLYDAFGLMEVWETPPPTIEQQLPVPRQFWQVGPQEFQRLGKVVQIGLRVLAYGTSIPFNILFSDTSVWSGEAFNCSNGIEDTYYIDVPKGVNGRIMRVVLGPCNFNFHPYYMKFKVAPSGGQENTELQWVTVPVQGFQGGL